MLSDTELMQYTLQLAHKAEQNGEVPVAAILVKHSQIIAKAWNQPISTSDPTAHAEIIALRKAAQQQKNYRLLDTTLYVTLEPCAMCLGAILHARVKRLVFGAYDPRAGAVQSVFQLADEKRLNHRLQYCGGVLAEECGAVLKSFFQKKRELIKEQ